MSNEAMNKTPAPRVRDIRCENGASPLGIGTASPRLSWKTTETGDNWLQESYEIRAEFLGDGSKEETGIVKTDRSTYIAWPFRPLKSREQVRINIRTTGRDAIGTAWSAPLTIESGLLSPDDWSARFIGAEGDDNSEQSGPSPLLRKEFSLRARPAAARLYVTSLGLYEMSLNGKTVGDEIFSPGWTPYDKRLKYRTFDVTEMLAQGENALGAILADGWYRGRLGYNGGRRAIYGNKIALLAQLEITFPDGTRERVATDSSWKSHEGPILSSEIYDGEVYDARKECPQWAFSGFDDDRWERTREIEGDLSRLVTYDGPPVRRTEEIKARSVSTSPAGKILVDFGQNLVGKVRLTVQGPAGCEITLRHAEVLEEDELGIRPLRTARQTDRYILKGGAAETWEPRFTFHGFRYVQVDGWPGTPGVDDLTALVCHSDMERTGWFTCSDPLINKLHDNIVWSVRGNFFDIPTDCPQRDERLGWTGDIQVFAPTACYLFDCAGFLSSWLKDLALEQSPEGAVPYFIPNINDGPIVPSAGWGDAAVLVPWSLYLGKGDRKILEDQFSSLCSWVDHLESVIGSSHIWSNGFQFGDWLDPKSPPDRPGDSLTDSSLVATAYYARSAETASRIAKILNEGDKAARYASLSGKIGEAFRREFVAPSGRMVSDTATAYSLAIQFNLIREPGRRERAGSRLAELVRDAGYRISTGFIGTPLVCDALCATGHTRSALLLLMQKGNPSWLYPVTMGATTMWERWDSMLPSGRINPGDTTSFNHYALGSIADWLHRTIGGITPLEPGYKKTLVKPLIGGGLTRGETVHMTPYGKTGCRWKLEKGFVEMVVTVPPNGTARVEFPRCDKPAAEIGSGIHNWKYAVEEEKIPPITPDSTLSELFANEKVWLCMKKEIPYLACFETITQISSTTTISQQLDFLPDGEPYKAILAEALPRWSKKELREEL